MQALSRAMLCCPSVAPPAGVQRSPAAPRTRAAVACPIHHPKGTLTVAVARATPLVGRVSVRRATAGRPPVVVRAMAGKEAGKEVSAQVRAHLTRNAPYTSLHATSRTIALFRDERPASVHADGPACRSPCLSCPTYALAIGADSSRGRTPMHVPPCTSSAWLHGIAWITPAANAPRGE